MKNHCGNTKSLSEHKDMYNIFKRIQDVNPSYRLFYNSCQRLYEIHDLSNHHCSLCLTIKPEDLHAGVIKKLYQTRKENMKKIFLEMEESNRLCEEKATALALDKSKDVFNSIAEYSSHKNSDITELEMKNIINNLGD